MSKIDELRVSFFQESEDLLEGLTDGLEEMDSGHSDAETVNSVFRAVHSIKGGAGAFALDAVVRFAHRFENVLDALRIGNLSPTAMVLAVLTRSADHLAALIEAARDDVPTDTEISEGLIAELCTLTGAEPDAVAPAPAEFAPITIDLASFDADLATEATYQIVFTPSVELYLSGNEIAFLLRDLCSLGEANVRCQYENLPALSELDTNSAYLTWVVELKTEVSENAIREVFEFVDGLCDLSITASAVADLINPAVFKDIAPEPRIGAADPMPDAQNADKAPVAGKPSARSHPVDQRVVSSIRVELPRVDKLINLVGELVINQAMLTQCLKCEGLQQGGDIDVGLEELRSLTRQIQDSVMAIRAQPVKALFQRMSRIAREAGGESGKTLRVLTDGADTEIDKTVIEQLADPLTHMIRNAVDHGLEQADKRVAAGKAATGTIRLSAAHVSGRVVIEISDDGAGINRERVRKIAEEKGLVEPDVQLTPAETDNLIFLPGFSTACTLSTLSGRGVGMDVVKRAIQSLGGRVSITSTRGRGSTFSILLPLTLAVLDGMVIEVGGQTVVIPISTIVETIRLSSSQVFKLSTQASVVRVRGNYVPIIDVAAVLGYRAPVKEASKGVFLLVETADGARAALLIDDIHDQRQVVIKGLEENYGPVTGVAAATILGDGRIALILDPTAIVGSSGADGLGPAQISIAAAE